MAQDTLKAYHPELLPNPSVCFWQTGFPYGLKNKITKSSACLMATFDELNIPNYIFSVRDAVR